MGRNVVGRERKGEKDCGLERQKSKHRISLETEIYEVFPGR